MNVSRPLALKTWQFKYWAFLTGLPTSRTKTELQDLLFREVSNLPTPSAKYSKVVSVDMGIRNLAFCAIEAPPTLIGKAFQTSKQPIKVTTWRKMDLLNRREIGVDTQSESFPAEDDAKRRQKDRRREAALANEAFTPASLSKTALGISEEILSHSPSTILIERQRFRSGGAAAIQEWTVRVNMLESMLWACFETLRSQQGHNEEFPATHAISPARIAKFWAAQARMALHPAPSMLTDDKALAASIQAALAGRDKVDKKQKVDIVRAWISKGTDVELEFTADTESVAEAFRVDQRRSKAVSELAGGKLDDLADCLLQAVAWVRWRDNQLAIAQMWRAAKAGKGG